MDKVKIYGADWCEDTQGTRAYLDQLGVNYQYINVDADAGANEWVKQQNNGKRQTPTVEVGGRILIEPDNEQLEQVLRDAEV